MVLMMAEPTAQKGSEPSEVWRCAKCDRRLGTISGGHVTIVVAVREGRREIIAALPCVQRCGACGSWNERR